MQNIIQYSGGHSWTFVDLNKRQILIANITQKESNLSSIGRSRSLYVKPVLVDLDGKVGEYPNQVSV